MCDRFCCCMEPAATKSLCCDLAINYRRTPRSCRRAARYRRMAQPGFSDGLPRMCSTRKMYVGARTSLRISSRKRVLHYRLSAPIAVGYSNGANMATTLLVLRPETLAGAILLRAAQITLSDFQPPDLSRKPVLLLSGADDPTILPERFTRARRIVASVWRFARDQGSAGRT